MTWYLINVAQFYLCHFLSVTYFMLQTATPKLYCEQINSCSSDCDSRSVGLCPRYSCHWLCSLQPTEFGVGPKQSQTFSRVVKSSKMRGVAGTAVQARWCRFIAVWMLQWPLKFPAVRSSVVFIGGRWQHNLGQELLTELSNTCNRVKQAISVADN